MATNETIKSLNKNERKAMSIICADCDDIDGYGFTRMIDMVTVLVDEFKTAQKVGGYIKDLMDKNLIEVDAIECTVWVEPDVFEVFC